MTLQMLGLTICQYWLHSDFGWTLQQSWQTIFRCAIQVFKIPTSYLVGNIARGYRYSSPTWRSPRWLQEGLVIPFLVTDRQAVENITVVLPLGHELIQHGHETLVVGMLSKMGHFMDDDVLQALPWLACKRGIQADGRLVRVAAPPLGLHPAHKEPLDVHRHDALPLLDKRLGRGAQFITVPFLQKFLLTGGIRSWPDPQHQPVVAEFHGGRLIDLQQVEQVPLAPDVVALTVQILSGRLALLIPQLLLLATVVPLSVGFTIKSAIIGHAFR